MAANTAAVSKEVEGALSAWKSGVAVEIEEKLVKQALARADELTASNKRELETSVGTIRKELTCLVTYTHFQELIRCVEQLHAQLKEVEAATKNYPAVQQQIGLRLYAIEQYIEQLLPGAQQQPQQQQQQLMAIEAQPPPQSNPFESVAVYRP